MSKEYGWTPNQIGQLTLAQVYVYYAELEDVGEAKKTTSASAAMTLSKREMERKTSWTDKMREMLRWQTKT